MSFIRNMSRALMKYKQSFVSEHFLLNSRNLLSAMRRFQIQQRTQRHNATRINFTMRHEIVIFDVRKIGGSSKCRNLIKFFDIAPDMGIVNDSFQISFEVRHVNRVKSDQSCKKANVSFRHLGSGEIAIFGQNLFDFVETFKNSFDGRFVGFLSFGKSTFVNSVVNGPKK